MSKIADALQKLKHQRQGEYQFTPLPADRLDRKTCFIVSGALMIAVISSIILNISMIGELKNSWKAATVLAAHLKQQEKDITELKLLVASDQPQYAVQAGRIHDKLSELENMISQLPKTENPDMKLVKMWVDDLKFSDKLLMEKYIDLNGKVKEMTKGR